LRIRDANVANMRDIKINKGYLSKDCIITQEKSEPTMAGPLHARKPSTGWGRLKPVSDPLDSVGFTSKGDTR
jgi:hypothetical protein